MLKMLVADDERLIRESLSELIDWNSLDIEIVACCKNGVEALDAIVDEGPHIIITDIRMPGLTGLELIEKIRETDLDLEIIILSGYQDFEYAKTAMSLGVKHYLVKPIEEAQIIETVRTTRQAVLRRLEARQTPAAAGLTSGQLLEQVRVIRAREGDDEARHLLRLFIDSLPAEGQLQWYTEHLLNLGPAGQAEEERRRRLFAFLWGQLPEKARPVSLAGQVKAYVRQHLEDPGLSLKWLAENVLYMNVDHLSRRFQNEAGEKFSIYLNRTRVERAMALLRTQDMDKLSLVARQVGFSNNPRYFGIVFKKYTGLTPGQYKQQNGREEG